MFQRRTVCSTPSYVRELAWIQPHVSENSSGYSIMFLRKFWIPTLCSRQCLFCYTVMIQSASCLATLSYSRAIVWIQLHVPDKLCPHDHVPDLFWIQHYVSDKKPSTHKFLFQEYSSSHTVCLMHMRKLQNWQRKMPFGNSGKTIGFNNPDLFSLE